MDFQEILVDDPQGSDFLPKELSRLPAQLLEDQQLHSYGYCSTCHTMWYLPKCETCPACGSIHILTLEED